jgi:hypothetical protein
MIFFGCFKHRLVGVCCQHPEQQCVDMHFKLLIKIVMLCGKWHDTDWTTPKSISDFLLWWPLRYLVQFLHKSIYSKISIMYNVQETFLSFLMLPGLLVSAQMARTEGWHHPNDRFGCAAHNRLMMTNTEESVP